MRWHLMCVLTMVTVCIAATHIQAEYVSAVLADAPFQYYRMQEASVTNGTTAVNSGTTGVSGTYSVSGGGFTDVAGAVAELTPGKQFTAGSGNTGARILLTPQGSRYGSLSAFTFEFLLKPGPVDSNYQALYTSDWNTNRIHVNLLGTLVYIGGESGVDISEAMSAGKWIHLVLSHDASGTTKYYVNGSLAATCSGNNTAIDFNANASIGNWLDSWTGDNRWYKGQMDEFAVYDYALGATAVATHASFVPEPGVITLLISGLLGLAVYAWRRRR